MNKKMAHSRIVVGNWKMNPASVSEAKKIFDKVAKGAARLHRTQVVTCPTFPHLAAFAKRRSKVFLGSQDVFWEESGAFTGEVSVPILKDLGVRYVIVGHSERRQLGESDETVAKKALAAIRGGLTAIVCVGETARDAQGAYLEFLSAEIKKSLAHLKKEDLNRLIVAYEPIWEIGAKNAMLPSDIHETSLFVRKILTELFGKEDGFSVPVLYGGSVHAANAGAIISDGQVEGLLVGRDSLLEDFMDLLKSVDGL